MAFSLHSEMANRSLTGEYQDAIPGGGQCWQWCGWLHHSSDPLTPQQGEQVGPPLHSRCLSMSSHLIFLLAVHAPVCSLLLPGSVVGSRCDIESNPSSNWEGRCRPLDYLTFDLEPHGKKNLLQSDWTDTRLVHRNRIRVYSERRDAQNERQERSSLNCVHKLTVITLHTLRSCQRRIVN